MGGRAEMDRLLALAPGDLELERCDVITNLGGEATLQRGLKAVVSLFRMWLFRVGAQELGATEAR